MNRAKSYRALIVILFLAFISLLSRSLIYLAISLTVAVLIIILLSRDVQASKNEKTLSASIKKNDEMGDTVQRSSRFIMFPALYLFFGFVMTAYSFTGYFGIESIFHDFGWMIDEAFVLILLLITGVTLLLHGLICLLKVWLS